MNDVSIKMNEVSGFLKASLDSCRLDFSELTPIETKREVTNLVNLVIGLKEMSDCSKYLQGGLIAQLSGKGRWKQYSEESKNMSWPEFCENVLGIGFRNANYIMMVYRKVGYLGLNPEMVEEIGWTKCKELMRVATQDTIDEWIEKARVASTRQVIEQVRAASKGVEIDKQEVDANLTTLNVKLTPEQKQNVESAFEDCQAEAQLVAGAKVYDRGALLDLIVTDWRANHIRPKARSLEWHLRQIRRAYDVEIVIEAAK